MVAHGVLDRHTLGVSGAGDGRRPSHFPGPACRSPADSTDLPRGADPCGVSVTAFENAIYDWVVAGSGLAADRVIWSGRGPAPAGTYISMRLLNIGSVSQDWLVPVNVSGSIVYHIRGTRNPTLELTCIYADRTGDQRPEMILDRVRTAKALPSVAATLKAGGVGVGKWGPVRVVPGVRSQLFDPRAIVEIDLHSTIDIADPVAGSAIEHVQVQTETGAGTQSGTVDKP